MGLQGLLFGLARDVVILRVYLEQFQIGKLNLVLGIPLTVALLFILVYLLSNVQNGGLIFMTRKHFDFGLS